MSWKNPLVLGGVAAAAIGVTSATTSPRVESAAGAAGGTVTQRVAPTRAWWKEAVIYQVYPRSFKDSNGDGIGDLRGITEKLDYLKQLGVDTIWLCPTFKSPNADNGYDVSDYRDIMADFGTMADFDRLLAAMKARSLRLILDLVPNHSSDEHPWFVESRKSKHGPYRDYYFWRAPRNGGPPTSWRSFFSGSAWELDPATGEYYLHLFARKQPDLNWDNPKVRREMHDIMRFWLDKGISGWRIDVVPFISKHPSLADYPPDFDGDIGRFHANGPRLHEYLQEMHREVLSRYDMMTVAEGIGQTPETGPLMVDERRQELHMLYHFDHMGLDRKKGDFFQVVPFSLVEFKAIFSRWDAALGEHGWVSILLGNHDFPRMVSRWGDAKRYRVESAKMLGTLLMTMRGTPYIYQGDELGMTNSVWSSIEEFNDIQTKNAYAEVVAGGGDTGAFLRKQNDTSRDNARTPFHWDATPAAGFTTGRPWLKVNPNHPEINARRQLADEGSVLHYFRRVIALRRSNPVLVYGAYRDLDPSHAHVFAYTRGEGPERVLVALNFSPDSREYTAPGGLVPGPWLLGNHPPPKDEPGPMMRLRPYEARVYRLGEGR